MQTLPHHEQKDPDETRPNQRTTKDSLLPLTQAHKSNKILLLHPSPWPQIRLIEQNVPFNPRVIWRSGRGADSHKDEHAMGIYIGNVGREMLNIQKYTEHFRPENCPTQNDSNNPYGETYWWTQEREEV